MVHRNGKRIKSLRGAFALACEAAGCTGRIPHDLRRSAVGNMERSGLSRSVAMQLTGHKTEAVYRRYAITSAARGREVECAAARGHGHDRDKKGTIEGIGHRRAVHETQNTR